VALGRIRPAGCERRPSTETTSVVLSATKTGLEVDNLIAIINKEIELQSKAAGSEEKVNRLPISIILLVGLERTLPCPAK